jgi:hypothetical protein
MKWIWDASEFVRKVRTRMRFGERSRLPLRLLRLELRHETAVCEWMARANDPWDSDLPIAAQEQNQAFQALQDAMTVREFLFATLPEVSSANFMVYRPAASEPLELIIAGTVTRADEPLPRVSSLVMRAKLCGLRFSLSDGVFEALNTQVLGSELTK